MRSPKPRPGEPEVLPCVLRTGRVRSAIEWTDVACAAVLFSVAFCLTVLGASGLVYLWKVWL